MKKLIIAALFSACGPYPIYVTKCGMTFYGDLNGNYAPGNFSQYDVQDMEDEVLRIFSTEVTDSRFTNIGTMCSQLKYYKMYTMPVDSWYDPGIKLDVMGETNCISGSITLADRHGLSIKQTAFAHEMAHVMQSCRPLPPTDKGYGDSHSNWERDSIYHAVDIANTP